MLAVELSTYLNVIGALTKNLQNLWFDKCLDWITSYCPGSSNHTVRVRKYMYVLFVSMMLSLRAGGAGAGISQANYENCLIIVCTLQFEILVTDSPD